MKKVTLYSTSYCGYCKAAKSLLEDQEVLFTELDVTEDFEKRQWLLQVTGQRTVPQIFIDETPIGGYSELSLLVKNKQFKKMLE